MKITFHWKMLLNVIFSYFHYLSHNIDFSTHCDWRSIETQNPKQKQRPLLKEAENLNENKKIKYDIRNVLHINEYLWTWDSQTPLEDKAK